MSLVLIMDEGLFDFRQIGTLLFDEKIYDNKKIMLRQKGVSLFDGERMKNMLDIKFVRENPDVVRENIKKKFQDHKLPLVDEVIELDQQRRENQAKADAIRAEKNKISKEIGALMAQGKKEEAEEVKKKVAESSALLKE